MSNSIKVDKKYGLNPSLLKCPICGKDMGIALFGSGLKDAKTHKTMEAPYTMAIPGHICDDCKEILDKGGYFFIEVRDGEAAKGTKDPYRTGRIIAINEDAAKRVFPEIENKIQYMEESLFSQVFGDAVQEYKENTNNQ